MKRIVSPPKVLRRFLKIVCWLSASMLMAQEVAFDQRHLWEAHERVRVSPVNPQQVGHRELGAMLQELARRTPETLHIEEVGTSVEGRALYLVRAGRGSQRVLMWSQMHGDEPTATSALLDILSYLTHRRKEPCVDRILEGATLLVMPMLNPDGAARGQRRNALGIDINRDARDLQTPEARALKAVHQQYRPQFAFNLHDQSGRKTVGRSGRLAAVALLAPPFDWEENDNAVRIRAKKVASLIAQSLAPFVYGHISRYDAGFMPRAFGDAMQAWGTSTVLLETGGWYRDDPQFMVRLNFVALLTALYAIATGTVEQANPALYDALPENGDPLYDLLIMDGAVWDGTHEVTFVADLGINFDPSGKGGSDSLGVIAEVGDLDGFAAKDTIDARGSLLVPGSIAPLRLPEPVSLVDTLRSLLAAGYTSAFCICPLGSAEQLLSLPTWQKGLAGNLGVVVELASADMKDTCAALRLAACFGQGALGAVVVGQESSHAQTLCAAVATWFGRPVVASEHILGERGNSASREMRARYAGGAAETFHLSDRGRIAVGQVADLALVELPAGVPLQELARAQVRQVLVAGRVAWKDGQLVRADLGRMLRKGDPAKR